MGQFYCLSFVAQLMSPRVEGGATHESWSGVWFWEGKGNDNFLLRNHFHTETVREELHETMRGNIDTSESFRRNNSKLGNAKAELHKFVFNTRGSVLEMYILWGVFHTLQYRTRILTGRSAMT